MKLFSDLVLAVNPGQFNDFHCWVFQPGMLFNETQKWWGDLGRRDYPHEGVDFCLYRNHDGNTRQLNYKTRISAFHDGIVRQIFSDYLGWALVIEHKSNKRAGERKLSIYAHVKPGRNMDVGVEVTRGQVIGAIADTRQSKNMILPHLHYTVGKLIARVDFSSFVWNHMRDPNIVTLLDPFNRMKAAHS